MGVLLQYVGEDSRLVVAFSIGLIFIFTSALVTPFLGRRLARLGGAGAVINYVGVSAVVIIIFQLTSNIDLSSPSTPFHESTA